MLTTLRAALANPRYRDLRTKYQAFFERFAEEAFLDADDVRTAASGLKYPINDNIVDFGNGNYLPLPQGSAEISLAWLALKTGLEAVELISRLTRPTRVLAQDEDTETSKAYRKAPGLQISTR